MTVFFSFFRHRGRLDRISFAPWGAAYLIAFPPAVIAFAKGAGLATAAIVARIATGDFYLTAHEQIALSATIAGLGGLFFAVFSGPVTRRLHDRGVSFGRIAVLFPTATATLAAHFGAAPGSAISTAFMAVAVVIFASAALFVFLPAIVQRGFDGENRFGPDPLSSTHSRWRSVLSLFLSFVIVIAAGGAGFVYFTGKFKFEDFLSTAESGPSPDDIARTLTRRAAAIEEWTVLEFLDECAKSSGAESECYGIFELWTTNVIVSAQNQSSKICFPPAADDESPEKAIAWRQQDLEANLGLLKERPAYWGYGLRIIFEWLAEERHGCL